MNYFFNTQKTITGEDIRQFRKITGIDRKTLAALACVSPRTVEHWENGNAEVTGPIIFLRHMIMEGFPELAAKFRAVAVGTRAPEICPCMRSSSGLF